MERDSLKDLLYSLARFGLFWAINLFGVIIGKTAILGVLGTLIPRLRLYDNTEILSFISWLVPAIMLFLLFADDAKRHTAYRTYSPALVSAVMIITGATYYIPALVTGYITSKQTISVLTELYFTSYWLSPISDNVAIYGLLGAVVQVLFCILTYVIARRYYLKKFESGEYEYEV